MCEKWWVTEAGLVARDLGGSLRKVGFAPRGLLQSEAGCLNESYLQIHTYMLCLRYIYTHTHTHTYTLKLYIYFLTMGLTSTTTRHKVRNRGKCLDRKDFVKYSTVHVDIYLLLDICINSTI